MSISRLLKQSHAVLLKSQLKAELQQNLTLAKLRYEELAEEAKGNGYLTPEIEAIVARRTASTPATEQETKIDEF